MPMSAMGQMADQAMAAGMPCRNTPRAMISIQRIGSTRVIHCTMGGMFSMGEAKPESMTAGEA